MRYRAPVRAKQAMINWVIWAVLLCAALLVVNPGLASADNPYGTPTSVLTVKVGSAGNFTTAGTFSMSDLQQLPQVTAAYSTVDFMPAPRIIAARGVKLTDLLGLLKIDLSSVQSLTFRCTDGYITNFTRAYLLDTPRYYYPNITADFDAAAFPVFNPGAEDGKVAVDPLLAEVSYNGRFLTAPPYNLMDGTESLRLCFGQSSVAEQTSFKIDKWVQEIDVTAGSSSVSLSAPAAGSTYQPGAKVTITGTVSNLAAVDVSVTDPAGQTVYTASGLDTSSDSLAAGFTLDSAASDGLYTVTVSGTGLASPYTANFKVVNPAASVSLSAPAAGQTYWPGNEVTVTGTVSNLPAVAVKVTDPNGNAVFIANDLDAGSGSFTTGFPLGSTAAAGAYTVAVDGAGLASAYKSSFKVINPGDLIRLASPTAGQNYQPGSQVTVSGTVYNLPAVAVTVTDPNGQTVYTASGLNTSNGNLATTFNLGSGAATGRYTIAIGAPSLVAPYTAKFDVGQNVEGGPNPGLPDQIILSWTGDPEQTQTISWRTGGDTTQDEVEYQPAASFTGSFAGARSITATGNYLYSGSYHFEATLQGLSPGTSYEYRVGREGAWSQPASFTTDGKDGSFSFLYMGDVQEGYGEWGDLLKVAAKENPGPKFALLGGDLVNDSTQDQWQQFFAAATPLFSQIPLLPAAGNHDESHNGATLFWDSFAVPQNGPQGLKGFYSFDYGNCHIAVLDSNLLAAPGTTDYSTISAWLEKDLNSSGKTWKFLVFHYPPYQAFPDDQAANLKANWVPLFEQCNVDAVFDGHEQLYMRTRPMMDGKIQADGHGIVYIMGNGGTKYNSCGPAYDYIATEMADLSSFEVITISGDTFALTAKDANGNVIDSYTFQKQSPVVDLQQAALLSGQASQPGGAAGTLSNPGGLTEANGSGGAEPPGTDAAGVVAAVTDPGSSVSLTAPQAGQAYQPGEMVTISGTAQGLDTVSVEVDDPAGKGVYYANDLNVDNGSFTTEFPLGTTSIFGTYSVEISAPGLASDDTGSFMVVDSGISLTTPAADQTYDPGDTVSVAGTVGNLATVTVTVTGPDGNNVFTASNLNTGDGSLATSFTLSGAAATGRYAVTISAPSLVTSDTVMINVGQNVAGGPNTGQPDEIILSWTDDPATTETVSWRIENDTAQDMVEYLPAANFSGSFAGAQEATAGQKDLTGSVHCEATLRGLTPDTGYVYRVGCDGAWSEPASFTTAGTGDNFSFIYMGDVQQGYQEWGDLLHVAAAEKPGPKFAFLGGDIVDEGSSIEQWQQLLAAASPLFSQVSLMPAPGNHDDGSLEWTLFAVPQNGPQGLTGFYSFDYGNCHFTVLDSNYLEAPDMGAPGDPDYDQISTWLRHDLDSSSKTWKFLVFHYPPYQIFPDTRLANLKQYWAPLFEQCGVDAVFVGHQQVYARTKPLRGGQIQGDGKGIVYIMGNAGTEYLPNGPNYDYIARELAGVNSYEMVNINGDTFTLTAKDAEGRPFDIYTIRKSPPIQG